MERVKVMLPDSFLFSTTLHIRITDVNYGGHVGNDVFLSLVHEARQQFLLHHGYTELDFAGPSLIMADAAIEYKHELRYGNTVRISVAANGFDKIGFDILYLIEVSEADKWQLAGRVKTGMICYDYAAKKKVSIPPDAIKKLTN